MNTPERTLALAHVLLMLTACGGAPPPAHDTAPTPASGASGDSRETALQRCLRDGPDGGRSDYAYIASYECSDGSVPLGGDPARGAAARLRNVGQGPDGHVIDLYRVPCPSGPVQIYIDPYHCGPGVEVGIDPNNLRPEQLQMMAERMRELETDPRNSRLRQSLFDWLQGSPQVHLSVCPAVIEAVVHRGYHFGELIFSQFVLSMGAAVIELGDGPEHRNQVALASVIGALRLHQSLVDSRGEEAIDPRLRALVRMPPGELEAHVEALAATCEEPRMGLTVSTDDGDVWPPSGPSCERFVRCCESNGLVENGVAVPNTAGLFCLLAAAPPDVDCVAGLSMLAAQGTSCPP